MKNAFRLALLLALAFAAFWMSTPKPAYALPTCDNLDGRSCLREGQGIACNWLGGGGGACVCFEGTWSC
jgi:hypothetical protein